MGISAYTVRPAEAKRDKPIVSAFIGGSVKKIQALRPDLVIGFSDIQAKLAGELIAAGLQVLIFNQRSLSEILDVMLIIGRLVGAEDRARALVDSYQAASSGPRARRASAHIARGLLRGVGRAHDHQHPLGLRADRDRRRRQRVQGSRRSGPGQGSLRDARRSDRAERPRWCSQAGAASPSTAQASKRVRASPSYPR